MPKCLTPAQIEQYREEGCVFPIRVMSETEAAELRGRLEAFERRTSGPLKGDLRHKSHLLFAWLAELVRRSAILDAIEDLHGPDLLCWTTNFFIKEAGDPAFGSWHQDSTYWGLSTPDVVTAWVAFTPATEANGAMEYIPGSHKLDQIPHRDTFAKHNLLTRGQEVMVEVDHADAARAPDRGRRPPMYSLMVSSHVSLAELLPAVLPSARQVRADALPAGRGQRTRRRTQPIAPAATSTRSAGTPASFTRPNKTSTTIAIRNARTGLSTAAPAINHMAQVGRLFTTLPPADSDLGYLAPRRSIPRPAHAP
jgi:Phytanoyl-CoA dioxygenase (PhyH)